MKAFLAKYGLVVGIVVVVVAAGGIYWYVASSSAPSFGGTTVTRGNVVASVDEPANVLAENSVALSFQEAGQIVNVNVQEGQTVGAGTVIASLDRSALQANVDQANAALAAAQAHLQELQNGMRPEQIAVNQSAVANARASVAAAAQNAYSAADDAVRNQTDNFFTGIQTNNPTFIIPTSNSQLLINIQANRVALGAMLANWYAQITSSSTNPATIAATANTGLSQVNTYLDTISIPVNGATPSSAISATTLAGYKINLSTARAEVTAAVNALTAAQSALATAQSQLTLAQAGATSQDIAAQNAAVLQAQAAVANAQLALNHASIIAPFSGTVQNLAAQVGQVVSPQAPVLTLVNNQGLKIQAFVSQTDVAKIASDDKVNVVLDAFDASTTFPATVTTIANAETQVNGAGAYEVIMHFTNPDSRLKDGMTGNAHIIVAEHDNVLMVPSRLVINDGNDYFVLVQQGKTSVRQSVEVGIVGDNGMTEITSGLNEGDTLTDF